MIERNIVVVGSLAPDEKVGTGPNEEIAPEDLANALGSDALNTLSQETGMSMNDLLAGFESASAGLDRSTHANREAADRAGGSADGIGRIRAAS